MPTYSYSGNTYTDKTDLVDKIQAAHVNDLQDEVEIVEGVLTGGEENKVLVANADGKASWKNVQGEDVLSQTSIKTGMTVAGAGTSFANGNYTVDGTNEGKPLYTKDGGERQIIWNSSAETWYIYDEDEDEELYYSEEDVATPDLCETWIAFRGDEPVPTVTAILGEAEAEEGHVLTADGDGGASWQSAGGGGGLVSWNTALSVGSVTALYDELMTALGISYAGTGTNIKYQSNIIYMLHASDCLYLLYHLGGDYSGYYLLTVKNYGSGVWPSGTVQFLGASFNDAFSNSPSYDWMGS